MLHNDIRLSRKCVICEGQQHRDCEQHAPDGKHRRSIQPPEQAECEERERAERGALPRAVEECGEK
jgi:hypothetical protein